MKKFKPHTDHNHPGYSVIRIIPTVQKKVIGANGKPELVDDYVGEPYTYKVPRDKRRKTEIELKALEVKYQVVSL